MKKRFKKDYHNKRYENPFFKKKKEMQQRPKVRRLKLSSLLLLVAIGGWAGFLLFAPYFQVENIDFGDTNKELQTKINLLLKAEFEKSKYLVLNNQNYFVFNEEDLKNQLGTIFLLNELKIEKKFPNTLLIKAKEKSDVLVLKTDKDAYFVDMNGLVVDKVPDNFKLYVMPDRETSSSTILNEEEEPELVLELSDEIMRKMPVISIESLKEVNIRDEIMSKELVSELLEVYNAFISRLGVSPKLFDVEGLVDVKIDSKLTVITKNGWEVYFSLNEPVNMQLENLRVLLTEKIGENRDDLEYIDLRFGDKLYYKLADKD